MTNPTKTLRLLLRLVIATDVIYLVIVWIKIGKLTIKEVKLIKTPHQKSKPTAAAAVD